MPFRSRRPPNAQRLGELQEGYDRLGYCVLNRLFLRSELSVLKDELSDVEKRDGPEMIVETSGEPSSVYITPRHPRLYNLGTHPRLVTIASALVGGAVYSHQIKLNSKVAFRGSSVDWHRDFDFWHNLDGMRLPEAITAAILLDATDEHNAPLLVVQGSQRSSRETGATSVRRDERVSGNDPHSVGSWANAHSFGNSTVVGELKYTVADSEIREPFYVLKGGPGTTLFFHANLVHGSGPNMSPRGRRVLFATFNRVSNALQEVPHPRPQYIANRDFTPLRG